MSDLRAREGTSDEWDGEIVELVEEGNVVAIVYLDSDTMYAEFVPAVANESWAFDVSDLQTALDTAQAMLAPEEAPPMLDSAGGATDDLNGEEHPVDRLAARFDDLASRRGEEDEGFYPLDVAGSIIGAAEMLGLAVVSMEGFRLDAGFPAPISGLTVDTGNAHDGEPWPTFMAGCNVQAAAVLERWSNRAGLVVAMEVSDRDGERYVL